MPADLSEYVDAVRRHYDDGCFACGRENPIGLHLDYYDFDGTEVSARFTPREHYRGAGNTLHGGVAAAALDEILVWAGILAERVITVTGTMELRFKRPLLVEETIVATARVDERRGTRLKVSGQLLVDAETRVTGSGLYLVSGDLSHLWPD